MVVGGAAMVLLFGARETTKDVDVVPLGGEFSRLRAAATSVAHALDLPEDWLNDGAKGYVRELVVGQSILETAALVVSAAPIEQLLAMKLSAWRDDVDVADARLLLSKLGPSKDLVWSSLERHLVPGRELKARYAFDDLWESRHGS